MTSGPPMYYIGCRLSLMSKAKLRYEGTLAGIDTEKCTVELHNVQSYGTEERVPPPNVIPPTPGSYDLIIFNGHDLDDLKVIPDRNPIEMQDPAIINAPKRNEKRADSGKKSEKDDSKDKKRSENSSSVIGQKPAGAMGQKKPKREGSRSRNQRSEVNQNINKEERRAPVDTKPSNAWKTGNLAQKTRETGRDQRDQNRSTRYEEIQRQKQEREKKERADLEKYKQTEFDFNAGLAKFDKEVDEKKNDENTIANNLVEISLEDDVDKKSSKKKSKKYYDAKSSIFDNISSEVADAESAKAHRMPRFQERKLNSETFGIPEKPMFYNNNRQGDNNRNYNNQRSGGYNNYRGYNNNRTQGYNPNNRGYNNSNNRGVNTGYNRDNSQRSAGIGGGYVRGRGGDRQ